MLAFILFSIFIGFVVSASAGMGGSLILVPILALTLGSKTGIAISAILLGCNNLFKVIAYRRTIPLKSIFKILILIALGAGLGSAIMARAPEIWVDWAIIISFFMAFLFERKKWTRLRSITAPGFAFLAGISSGFSGTSGPLKGIALRNLKLNRFYFVGGASVISLAGDLVKASVYFQWSFFGEFDNGLIICSLFIMPIAVYIGKLINEKIGERAYTFLFWVVMLGYSIRILLI